MSSWPPSGGQKICGTVERERCARASGRGRLARAGEQLIERPAALERAHVVVAADRLTIDEDLRHRGATGDLDEPLSLLAIARAVDVLERDALVLEEALGCGAVPAPLPGVDDDLRGHDQTYRGSRPRVTSRGALRSPAARPRSPRIRRGADATSRRRLRIDTRG